MTDRLTCLHWQGSGTGQLLSVRPKYTMSRIVFSSLLRLSVGYMFLVCLFLVIVQAESVIQIFFDVLALEFVERIDDVIYALSKRGKRVWSSRYWFPKDYIPAFGPSSHHGFTHQHCTGLLGRKLRNATADDKPCMYCIKDNRAHIKLLVRIVYFLNICVSVGLLAYVTIAQQAGSFRCNKILVSFGDELWENAYVSVNGVKESRLLIYSHFNGIYRQDGECACVQFIDTFQSCIDLLALY